MGKKKPIYEIIDELPSQNITTRVLHALDFAMPGEWQNLVGFENTIRAVSGETDEEWIQKIGERAIWLYNDKKEGYQRALWLYRTVDSIDDNLAKAALAHKVGQRIGFLSFLSRLTPKEDTLQTLDLSLKLVAELAAFCLINGIPGDSIGDFVKSLSDYSGESLMRMTALISIDGIIPLGPDFIGKVSSQLQQMDPPQLEKNEMYQKIRDYIPGDNASGKLNFVTKSFNSTRDWMSGFIEERGITLDKILGSIDQFVEFSEGKLDYLAAFLDMTTNYYEHTGTQTLARRLAERAVNEI